MAAHHTKYIEPSPSQSKFKKKVFWSRRSIPQSPTRHRHQWHDSTSKPAIPYISPVNTRFHMHPVDTNVNGSTPYQIETRDCTSHSKRMSMAANHSPPRPSIPRGAIGSFTTGRDCLKAVSRVWTLIDASCNPAMRDKTTKSHWHEPDHHLHLIPARLRGHQ